MRTLVLYESMYGNTRHIAEAIGRGARVGTEVDVVPASHAGECDLASYDLLIVGGPTHIHGLSSRRTRDAAINGATKPNSNVMIEADASATGIREWLSTLTSSAGRAAAFDTRLDRAPLMTGRASRKIAKRLRRAGMTLVCAPESFLVDTNSNLKAHEDERAEEWGRALVLLAESGPGK